MAGAVFRTLYTLHSALCTNTPHSTKLYTPHFTLYTLHSTLYTLHFTLNTLHPALYTPHFTLYTPQLTIYTLHSTLYILHFTLHTPEFTLYILNFTPYTPHFTFYTPHFTLYTPHSTIPTSHSTQHSPLNIPLSSRSTLCTSLPSTFHSVYSALVRQHGNRAQNCSNNLFHNSVLRDCVQVRGLHLVFMEMLAHLEEIIFLDFL